MIIKTKKFIIRPYRKEDEWSIIKNINSLEVSRYLSTVPFPYKLKDARWWINHNKALEKKKEPKGVNFAIEIDSNVAGGIGFKDIISKHKAEIGYWLGKKYWNKGIMTEAVKLMTDFGFKKLKLKRIYATVLLKNRVSARVLEKNKYKFEGVMKKYHLKKGKLIDALLYAKTK